MIEKFRTKKFWDETGPESSKSESFVRPKCKATETFNTMHTTRILFIGTVGFFSTFLYFMRNETTDLQDVNK